MIAMEAAASPAASPTPPLSPTVTATATVLPSATPAPNTGATPVTEAPADDEERTWLRWLQIALGSLLAVVGALVLGVTRARRAV